MSPTNRFDRQGPHLSFTVSDESQAAELEAAWREIVAGKRRRLNVLEKDQNEIIERARVALETIVHAIGQGPDTGQGRRLIRFLAGMYNGQDYPFDLTDLRALDSDLATACLDYLNYDRLGKVEVHTHLPGHSEQMRKMLIQGSVRRKIPFSSVGEHEMRLRALAEWKDSAPYDLLKDAVSSYLWKEEAKYLKLLRVAGSDSQEEGPVVHVRATGTGTPMCGAEDGPWDEQAFDFERIACYECKARVLDLPDEV